MRALAAACLLVLVSPLALAQGHAHVEGAGGAMVLFDGPPSGRAVVGAYTHFGFALLDENAKPVPHQNAAFVVTQNGDVLFSTTDTHEYDGLFSFDMRFTRPGPYQVMAMSGDMPMGLFEGEVVMPVNETLATISLTATPQGPASRVVDFELSITDAAGAILDHTDAIVEFRSTRDGYFMGRTHLHIHEEPLRFTQGFGPDTDYTVQVVGYLAFATGRGVDVPAVIETFPLSVGAVSAPGIPMPAIGPPQPLEQVGATDARDGLTLHAMYDPNNQVGVGQIARIAGAIVKDEDFATIQHVDFTITLSGPRGIVFASESLHEYDGVFEYTFRPDVPGAYDGVMTATHDETVLSVPVHLLVVPPVVPLLGGMGLIEVSLEGVEGIVAGKAANLTFRAMGPAGPAMHSEVDVTVFHGDEPPLYQFKLHTHDTGLTNALLQFPHDGDWQVRVDPLPTLPEAAFYPPALFALTVAAGDGIEDAGGLLPETKAQVPGISVALLILGASLALAARRRG